MHVHQSIPRPHGISVVGTHLVRAAPDRARLRFAVQRTDAKAARAMEQARECEIAVRQALRGLGVADAEVRSAELTLASAYDGYGAKQKKLGERATIGFDVIVADLAKVQPALLAVVEAGVGHIQDVGYHTSRLAKLRARARRGAVAAAREKATIYASAAGARLGEVLHIEDVSPAHLEQQRGHGEDTSVGSVEDADGEGVGSLTIAAAVAISWALLTD